MRKDYKKLTLRLDPDLHERFTRMLADASERQHQQVTVNYITSQLVRACCEEFERNKEDKRQPTFNAFVRKHLH